MMDASDLIELARANGFESVTEAIAIAKKSRDEIERLTADLDRYRYAVQWASADDWDAGGEMRARFEWARGEDRGAHLDNDRAAKIGQIFLKTTGRLQTKKPHDD